MGTELENRLDLLINKGVTLVDARQTYVAEDVDLERVYPGAKLYPGTRLEGARTVVAPNAQIGTEGPATIQSSVVGQNAEVASGFLNNAVLLARSRAGSNSHFRGGTLLEEEASTAHAVGLKQTVLMCYVTAGSLINFCDALVSGGRSRKEHSEIGSGFIHFNYTPWGKQGDKATASLIGNVVDGVFLDRDRVFLGGLSGLVGPERIGFGAFTVAGQIIRKSVGDNAIYSEAGIDKEGVWKSGRLDSSPERALANVAYLAQLIALQKWYTEVRLRRAQKCEQDPSLRIIITEAVRSIEGCTQERLKRFNSYAAERDMGQLSSEGPSVSCSEPPDVNWKPEEEYTAWVLGLDTREKLLLRDWLHSVASSAEASMRQQTGL
jgi:hypothetical protein